MRQRVAFAAILVPVLAAAQPGMYPAQRPAPPPPPPPPGQVAPEVETESKARIEVAIVAGSPKGDWKEELAAETSPGFQLQLGFVVAPNLSLFGGARYLRVNYDESRFGTSELRVSHRELQIGARFMSPLAPAVKLFVEGNIHSATITVGIDGQSQSESGIGVGARAGVLFMLDQKFGVSLAASYGVADIAVDDGDDFEDAWLAGDIGLSVFL